MTASEEMKVLLDKINLLFNVFNKDGIEHISALEKELLKEQVNKLLLHLDQLGGAKASMVMPIQKEDVVEEKLEVIEPEEVREEEKVIPEIVAPAPIIEEPVVIPEILASETIEQVNVEPERVKVEEKISLVDSFIEKKEADKKSTNTSKPTRSLQQIIDLNKSFVLKAELFNNNHNEYAQFIDKLNQIENEDASLALVEQEAARMNWDKEEKAYELIVRAVEKRFLPLLQQ